MTSRPRTKITANGAQAGVPANGDRRLKRYLLQLKADYGRYARTAEEPRRIVDDSMGASSLTGLLYESREDGAK